jgi:ribosomal-protein-serine acetyltransferase
MNVVDAIPVSETIALRALERAEIGRVWEVIERNRTHLARWLTWAESATFETTRAFLEDQIAQHEDGRIAIYGIWWNGRLAGSIALRNLEAPAETNVGYYLAEFACGHGVMSASLRALANVAFTSLGVYRIELAAALGNMESRRVAERAGFVFEGIARARVIVHGRLHDAAVYARIATDASR